MRRRFLIALMALAAACGGTTAPTTTVPQPTTSQVVASPTTTAVPVAEDTTSTTASPESTTSVPAPTTTASGGSPVIRVDEIVFAGGPYVVISNRGTGAGSTDGYWICQFPSYFPLPAVELLPGEKLAIALGVDPVPELVGVVATVDAASPIGNVTPAGGEFGLYSDNVFNSADAIVDYIEWGTSGHARSGVAVEAGIWEANGFVEVPAEALAIVAQTFPTMGSDDWFAEIGG
jgi:hypothetical protein